MTCDLMLNDMQDPFQSSTIELSPGNRNHDVLSFNMAGGLKRGLK